MPIRTTRYFTQNLIQQQFCCGAIMRVAYNRIGKSGSSFMLNILTSLSKKNGFHLENHDDYQPSKEALARELRNLPNNSVYVNHAGFLQSEGGLIWLNVVREPIDRWASIFYYRVDPALRGRRATKELRDRQADTRCGCARLEFDECINLLYHHNCSMEVPSQIKSFCEPGEDCSRELATTHVDESYLLRAGPAINRDPTCHPFSNASFQASPSVSTVPDPTRGADHAQGVRSSEPVRA